MNAAQQRRLTPVLAIACALALLALLALGLGAGAHVQWHDATATTAVQARPGPDHLPPPPPLARYAAIWQRPLFNPDRRPAPVAMTGDASDATLGDLQLTGIIITPTLRMALLHNRKTGEDLSVAQGASLAGGRWTLQALAPRSATFDGEGGRTVLPLQVATHTGPGPQGNARAAPATATGAMVQVGAPKPAAHTRTAVPRLTLQAVGSEPEPSAAQIAAGNARKAAVKAQLKKRLEQQRRQQSQGAQGDH